MPAKNCVKCFLLDVGRFFFAKTPFNVVSFISKLLIRVNTQLIRKKLVTCILGYVTNRGMGDSQYMLGFRQFLAHTHEISSRKTRQSGKDNINQQMLSRANGVSHPHSWPVVIFTRARPAPICRVIVWQIDNRPLDFTKFRVRTKTSRNYYFGIVYNTIMRAIKY